MKHYTQSHTQHSKRCVVETSDGVLEQIINQTRIFILKMQLVNIQVLPVNHTFLCSFDMYNAMKTSSAIILFLRKSVQGFSPMV